MNETKGANRLYQDGNEVYYYCKFLDQRTSEMIPGAGFPFKKIPKIDEVIDKVDWIVGTYLYTIPCADSWRKAGKKVWGGGAIEKLGKASQSSSEISQIFPDIRKITGFLALSQNLGFIISTYFVNNIKILLNGKFKFLLIIRRAL